MKGIRMETCRVLKKAFMSPAILAFLAVTTVTGDYCDYVDMFLGQKSGDGQSGGSTVIGPQMPWGSCNPAPDTDDGHTDGYHPYEPIWGFSQMHVSGTGGRGNYGLFLVGPQTGFNKGHPSRQESAKANEIAEPNFYGVDLTDYDIRVELAPTHHCVIYRIIVPAGDSIVLPINIGYSIPDPIGKNFLQGGCGISRNAAWGWSKHKRGWSDVRVKAYFYAEVSETPTEYGVWENDAVTLGDGSLEFDRENISRENLATGPFYRFSPQKRDTIYLKLGVSMKSVEAAKAYLQNEIPQWDFESVKGDCRDAWNRELARVEIDTETEVGKRLFYSCYHLTMIMPRDRTGDNPSWDTNEPYYDDHYCLWDTWHTLFSLFSLTNKSRYSDIVRSMIDSYQNTGEVPDAFIAGKKGKNQGGANHWNVFAEAHAKGIGSIPWEDAYAACDGKPKGNPAEKSYGYFCKAQLAKAVKGESEYRELLQKSKYEWEDKWNPDLTSRGFTGFLDSEDPMKRSYYEANSWTASFGLPHDFTRLAELMGGFETAVDRLDYGCENACFLVPYGWGNQPTHKIPSTYAGLLAPYKSSYLNVNTLLPKYGIDPYSYIGNDDSGSNSSRYMFMVTGLFPLAGTDLYFLHGPRLEKAVFHGDDGKTFTVVGNNVSDENIYVQSVTLNGNPLHRSWVRHDEIAGNGTLVFEMGPEPSIWGTQQPYPTLTDQLSPIAVAITDPKPGKTYDIDAPVGFDAAVTHKNSEAIEKVEFYVDSQLIETKTNAPYTTEWTDASPGTHTFTVKAYDSDGNEHKAFLRNIPVATTTRGRSSNEMTAQRRKCRIAKSGKSQWRASVGRGERIAIRAFDLAGKTLFKKSGVETVEWATPNGMNVMILEITGESFTTQRRLHPGMR